MYALHRTRSVKNTGKKLHRVETTIKKNIEGVENTATRKSINTDTVLVFSITDCKKMRESLN